MGVENDFSDADFSGWVTKAGLKCSDGRTIMPEAFKHHDGGQVPLVWQHGHNDPTNVLGHVKLQHRAQGVYGYGYFNETAKAQHTQQALIHKDFNAMSIWANKLMEQAKTVYHGVIREVSLVLSGANPGALIENVTIRHSDDEYEIVEDQAIIVIALEHSSTDEKDGTDMEVDEDLTVAEVYESMDDRQKEVLHMMLGEALGSNDTPAMSHADGDGETVEDVYNSLTPKQKDVVHFIIGEAIASAGDLKQDALGDDNEDGSGNVIKHNVFEKDSNDGATGPVLSHDEIKGIVSNGKRLGSLKSAIEMYAEEHLEHGIQDIDLLFPDAKAITDTPELFGRRVEWVDTFMKGVSKSPFSRIKSLSADITVQEARAKGYIKGTLKKEEFFRVARRVTTPTTIYKKQKLDRDDMVDIVDFDVVIWLKGEMRLMLDEEVARACLVGDNRASDDEDKIDEERIRPIVSDHELYTSTIYVNIDDASSNMHEVSDAITLNRSLLRGTGMPTLFTTERYIARWLSQRDTLQRRVFTSIDQLATELRVSAIVPVEILEEYEDIVGILVNPTDYRIGMDKGGAVSMFDDFDIDYNQWKYLIETRLSGCLTKLKSALVVRKVAAGAVLVVPTPPTFDGEEVTIVNTTGVVYTNAETEAVMNAAGSPYAVAEGDSLTVQATPASTSYYFETSEDEWTFTNNEA